MRRLPSWRPTKLGMRVALDPDAFRRLILRRGSRLRWQRAHRCPCTVMGSLGHGGSSAPTLEARSDCRHCFGTGMTYEEPQEVLAVVLGAEKTPEMFQIYGERARGMVSVTLLPEHVPQTWDRFTVLGSVHAVSEMRERTGDRERLRYPVATATLELGARDAPTQKRPSISRGTHVQYADLSGLSCGALADGVDYRIDPCGDLEWLDPDTPALGARFSIDYWAHPTYIVEDTPHPHRDNWIPAKSTGSVQWTRYPVQVRCWLETSGPPHGYAPTT